MYVLCCNIACFIYHWKIYRNKSLMKDDLHGFLLFCVVGEPVAWLEPGEIPGLDRMVFVPMRSSPPNQHGWLES